MTKRIPIDFPPWPLAYDVSGTAAMLNVSTTTVWRLKNKPKSDPRRLRFTSYGVCPYTEIQRHLDAEVERR